MPQRTPEERKEYKRLYYLKNKEKMSKQSKEWKLKNPGYNKEYWKSEKGKKCNRINTWKTCGVISEDFNQLYEYYINCKNCEECNIELIEGNLGNNKRVLDHDHDTGLFRNVLCNTCNCRRRTKKQ